jgi:hypothetical protein
MKLVNIKWVTLLVISYGLALVVLTPLQWLLPLVTPKLAALGVTLEETHGSLWQGRSLVRWQPYGYSKVEWEVQPLALLLLKLPVQVSLENPQMALTGRVTITPLNLSVANITGYLDDTLLAPIYTAYKATLSGRLQLDTVAASVGWGKKLGDFSGNLTWSGGPVGIPVGRSIQNYQVPTLFGQLGSDEAGWGLRVQGERQQDYMQMSLTPTGEATLSVKRALADDMAIQVPGNGSSLFDISQQVF